MQNRRIWSLRLSFGCTVPLLGALLLGCSDDLTEARSSTERVETEGAIIFATKTTWLTLPPGSFSEQPELESSIFALSGVDASINGDPVTVRFPEGTALGLPFAVTFDLTAPDPVVWSQNRTVGVIAPEEGPPRFITQDLLIRADRDLRGVVARPQISDIANADRPQELRSHLTIVSDFYRASFGIALFTTNETPANGEPLLAPAEVGSVEDSWLNQTLHLSWSSEDDAAILLSFNHTEIPPDHCSQHTTVLIQPGTRTWVIEPWRVGAPISYRLCAYRSGELVSKGVAGTSFPQGD